MSLRGCLILPTIYLIFGVCRLRNNLIVSLLRWSGQLNLLLRYFFWLLFFWQLFSSDRSDRHVIFKPCMLRNFVELYSLRRIDFEQFRNQVFGDSSKASGPLNLVLENIAEQFVLVGTFKRRTTSQQFEEQNSQVPNIKRFIVARLLDHLGSKILGCSAVS